MPQNRERVFIVANLREEPRPKIFPFREISERTLKELTSGMSQGYRVYDTDGLSVTLAGEAGGLGAKTGLYTDKTFAVRDHEEWREKDDGVSNCLDASYYKFPDNHGARTGVIETRAVITPERLNKRQNGRRFKENGEPAFTVTAQDRHGVAVNNKIRKLTPLETFRLQGFPDEWYHKCREEGISDTQMYRAAGDSVTVNVVQAIAKRLKEE